MAENENSELNERLLWPGNHYGKKNRVMMARNRGELHLGEGSPVNNRTEYMRADTPVPEMKGQQSTKNPTKGNSKG